MKRDPWWMWPLLPLLFVVVVGWVAWRWLTCLVDSWGDIRAGRVPAYWRCHGGAVDLQTLRYLTEGQ